jgi:hypothetical protein
METTSRESTPKSVCFSFFDPLEGLPSLIISEMSWLVKRVRTEFFSKN